MFCLYAGSKTEIMLLISELQCSEPAFPFGKEFAALQEQTHDIFVQHNGATPDQVCHNTDFGRKNTEKSGCLFLESHFCFVSWFLFEDSVVKHCLMLLPCQPRTEVSRTHWQSNHESKNLHHLVLPDENWCLACDSAEKFCGFLKTSLWRSFYSHSF